MEKFINDCFLLFFMTTISLKTREIEAILSSFDNTPFDNLTIAEWRNAKRVCYKIREATISDDIKDYSDDIMEWIEKTIEKVHKK